MIRKTSAAGSFYEADPDKLLKEVNGYLKKGAAPAGALKGVLVPHAGYCFSGAAAGRALAALKDAEIDTLVIMATGHTMPLRRGALTDAEAFATPLGPVGVDVEFCAELLLEKDLFELSPRAHAGEHAVEVQLPFLRALKGDKVKIVPLLFNSDDEALLEAAGRAVGRAMKGRRALFCVSSDLSHYPPGDLAERSDLSALLALRQAMRNGAPSYFGLACGLLARAAGPGLDTVACGQAAMTAGAACALELGGNDFETALYTHSGKVSGDDSRVVGYGAGFYTAASPRPAGALELSPAMKKELLAMARGAIKSSLRGAGPQTGCLAVRPEFNHPAAVFVTLTSGGELRGCIGSLEARGTLSDMVRGYACAAAFEDPRFAPVTAAELEKLKVEISVLSPLERVAGADDIKEGLHGVYVKSGRRSGTYLPQVWEHFKKKEDFLSSLCLEKAGLASDAWKEKSTVLYRYTVDHFEE